jgi:cobalt-zinc-cadmium resistance protein CzcA
MVRALIAWSLHNRFVVLLGTVGLIMMGIYSAKNLNVEAYPDPTPPLLMRWSGGRCSSTP